MKTSIAAGGDTVVHVPVPGTATMILVLASDWARPVWRRAIMGKYPEADWASVGRIFNKAQYLREASTLVGLN